MLFAGDISIRKTSYVNQAGGIGGARPLAVFISPDADGGQGAQRRPREGSGSVCGRGYGWRQPVAPLRGEEMLGRPGEALGQRGVDAVVERGAVMDKER